MPTTARPSRTPTGSTSATRPCSGSARTSPCRPRRRAGWPATGRAATTTAATRTSTRAGAATSSGRTTRRTRAAESGLSIALARCVREALSDSLSMSLVFASADRSRHQQDIAAASLALVAEIPTYVDGLGPDVWASDPLVAPLRRARGAIAGTPATGSRSSSSSLCCSTRWSRTSSSAGSCAGSPRRTATCSPPSGSPRSSATARASASRPANSSACCWPSRARPETRCRTRPTARSSRAGWTRGPATSWPRWTPSPPCSTCRPCVRTPLRPVKTQF